MDCPKCNGRATKNGTDNGLQKYVCTECKYNFREALNGGVIEPKKLKSKATISMDELRERHDVDFKVQKVLESLKKGEFIEKDEIIKRTGLRPGYPRLSATLDSHKEYFGRADSKIYWGHPEEIAQLKDEQILS